MSDRDEHPPVPPARRSRATNAPGSRHDKRWQDVEELLGAGIDVYSTMNVQHIESLDDVAAQITGVRVRETVPDAIFDRADEIGGRVPAMRLFRASEQAVIPWKNGGGTTREIVREPAESSLETFVWRVSRARVAASGPFSIFAGVERTLLVLEGEGVTLDVAGRGSFTLTPEAMPFSFAGDVAVEARLLGGPIEDLNVMTRRGHARHEVSRRRITAAQALAPRGDAALVVVERGGLTLGALELAPGDAVLCEAGAGLTICPDPLADLILVEVML